MKKFLVALMAVFMVFAMMPLSMANVDTGYADVSQVPFNASVYAITFKYECTKYSLQKQ